MKIEIGQWFGFNKRWQIYPKSKTEDTSGQQAVTSRRKTEQY